MPRTLAALLLAVALLLPAASQARAEMQIHLTDPLAKATVEGRTDEVRRRLNDGASPNTRSAAGLPLLALAARADNVAMVTLLLERGARIDHGGEQGNTALHVAARHGSYAAAKRLIRAGGDLDAGNGQGMTPLMMAARHDQPQLVDLLLAEGADPGYTDYTGRDALMWARENAGMAVLRRLERATGG